MANREMFSREYINPYYLLQALLRNFWVPILVAAGLWMSLTACQKIMYKPTYRSSVFMVVNNKNSVGTYTSLKTTKEMAAVFAEVFQSDVLKHRVAEDMGVERLNAAISTEVIPETNLLRINVDADSPENAYNTLNLILEHYKEVSDYILDNAVLEVLKAPSVSSVANTGFLTHARIIQLTLIGALAAIAGILLLVIMSDTVQTVSGAKDKVDASLYAVIPYVKKRRSKGKTAILVTQPQVSLNYVEVMKNLGAMIEHRMRKHGHKVLLVSSPAENEGKSTVAANLALVEAEKGRKVLLVDYDFKKPSVYKIFEASENVKQDFSEYLLAKGKAPYEVTRIDNLDLALSQQGNSSAQCVNAEKLKTFIAKMREEYDMVILDSAPMMLISDTEAILKLSDTALLVVLPDYVPVGVINSCLDVITGTGDMKVGYVLNSYRSLEWSRGEKESTNHRKNQK